ncbi:hypothetical protein RhiirA1_479750 [Rhizophagus irregularis]|uniref:Uncharacterized protein n=1 Tax=Rhizophagus irregularis TaxID=588596 RepID=A0A2N0QQ94_9GLOM|nr:hypothetical protein RhiirA1_479750 [Rhizophagus irregularis]
MRNLTLPLKYKSTKSKREEWDLKSCTCEAKEFSIKRETPPEDKICLEISKLEENTGGDEPLTLKEEMLNELGIKEVLLEEENNDSCEENPVTSSGLGGFRTKVSKLKLLFDIKTQ